MTASLADPIAVRHREQAVHRAHCCLLYSPVISVLVSCTGTGTSLKQGSTNASVAFDRSDAEARLPHDDDASREAEGADLCPIRGNGRRKRAGHSALGPARFPNSATADAAVPSDTRTTRAPTSAATGALRPAAARCASADHLTRVARRARV